jgi:hypothetical protein
MIRRAVAEGHELQLFAVVGMEAWLVSQIAGNGSLRAQ